jgi:hypothetical protein
MDFLTKWKLNLTLSEEEAMMVLKELYDGSNKIFVFDSNTKIDQKLYSIYEAFQETQSDFVLKFSGQKTESPFVSLTHFDDLAAQHVIFCEQFKIFVY